MRLPVLPVFLVSLFCISSGCDDPAPSGTCGSDVAGAAGDPIVLESLACMTRHGDPVLRDPIEGIPYEVASDGHVFRDADGTLRMIYSGDHAEHSSIKLATGDDWDRWSVTTTLLGPDIGRAHKETSFYRRAADGTHQIYFIGYDDEVAYQSEVFVAEADALEGPYTVRPTPVAARGMQAGHDVYLITSPSVVEYEGVLHLVYLGWNDSPGEVTEVWTLGSTSDDDGVTWSAPEVVDVPVGMEGQLTHGPDGRYWAAASRTFGDNEGISLGVASHPFGPYDVLPDPVLERSGDAFELNEANAPMLAFDESSRTANLYYVGADYEKGWWMMLASTPY